MLHEGKIFARRRAQMIQFLDRAKTCSYDCEIIDLDLLIPKMQHAR